MVETKGRRKFQTQQQLLAELASCLSPRLPQEPEVHSFSFRLLQLQKGPGGAGWMLEGP